MGECRGTTGREVYHDEMRKSMAEIVHMVPKAVPEATRGMAIAEWQCPCRITALTAQHAFKRAADNTECSDEKRAAVHAVLAGVLPWSRWADAGTEEARLGAE